MPASTGRLFAVVRFFSTIRDCFSLCLRLLIGRASAFFAPCFATQSRAEPGESCEQGLGLDEGSGGQRSMAFNCTAEQFRAQTKSKITCNNTVPLVF